LEYIDDKYSVLKINIKTWRTHQIRVHLSSIGFPIIWDKVYWNKTAKNKKMLSFWIYFRIFFKIKRLRINRLCHSDGGQNQ
jgi:23S rRNA-/tRNA-specific pseudouridylate synthase